MKNVRFYKCEKCNNVMGLINGDINNFSCCGSPLIEMVPNLVEASIEKHKPVVEKDGAEVVVRVGSTEHPMTKEHYIMWIAYVSVNKTIRVTLYPEQETITRFPYAPNSSVYAYCNLHGLWKTDIK